MKKAGGSLVLFTVRAMQKSMKKTRRRWLGQLVRTLAVVLAVTCVDADEVNANMAEIPVGPGQACIKYSTFYSALVDWSGGAPVELSRYYYVSYDAVEYSHTVNSCVGGVEVGGPPGLLPEGIFFLLLGSHKAIVNIEQIENKCPYMLTYYYLKNPLPISDPDGMCVKGKPAPTNTPNPDAGSPECGNRAPLN